jgi:hypothetical protein
MINQSFIEPVKLFVWFNYKLKVSLYLVHVYLTSYTEKLFNLALYMVKNRTEHEYEIFYLLVEIFIPHCLAFFMSTTVCVFLADIANLRLMIDTVDICLLMQWAKRNLNVLVILIYLIYWLTYVKLWYLFYYLCDLLLIFIFCQLFFDFLHLDFNINFINSKIFFLNLLS